MESHTKRFLRIFLSSSATFLQYLQSSSSSSFSGHTPPFLPSHFFIQGSYSGSLVFSALDEKEQESEFVAVNPARRSRSKQKSIKSLDVSWLIKVPITTCTTEIVAKWMIPTELKKENGRDKNPKHNKSCNNDRAQGRRASKRVEETQSRGHLQSKTLSIQK